MSASDDLLVALANLINVMLDYEKAWNEYANTDARADNEFRIARDIAHQVLLDHARKYVELARRAGGVTFAIDQPFINQPAINLTIQSAVESNEEAFPVTKNRRRKADVRDYQAATGEPYMEARRQTALSSSDEATNVTIEPAVETNEAHTAE